MIPFIKKYKFFIITAAAVVAALVIAFAAGNSIQGDVSVPDETATFSTDATSATGTITHTTAFQPTSADTTAKESEGTTAETTSAQTTAEPATRQQTTAENSAAEHSEPTEPTTDKYKTDPVPTDKPKPVEPQEQTTADSKSYCTFSISCATILDNKDKMSPDIADIVPSDGWIMKPEKVEITDGESVFDVLVRLCREKNIHMEYTMTPIYNSAYIEGIANIYEFDCGDLSGWMYKVNDWYPNYGCSRYVIENNDTVEWNYTCDSGRDLGNEY